MKQAVKLALKKLTAKTLAEAYRMVDRAAKRNIVHKNTAARLKSRLAKKLKNAKPEKVKVTSKVKVKVTKVTKKRTTKPKKVTKRPTARKATRGK